MTMSIDIVTFDNDMMWDDRKATPDGKATQYTSIAGNEIVVEVAKGAHFPITLKSDVRTGKLLGSTVTSLKALAAQIGYTYDLTIGVVTYAVRFRNEIQGGAISMRPLVAGLEGESHYWIGTINLMCVG
jgi:hypothetical protein